MPLAKLFKKSIKKTLHYNIYQVQIATSRTDTGVNQAAGTGHTHTQTHFQ